MQKIITITFNPAIDNNSSVQALIPEHKLKCTTPVYEPGGGGINVARAIKKLGGEAMAVYLAGGCTGNTLEELLERESVPSILIKTTDSTRENLNISELVSNQQYRFIMPGPFIQENEWHECLQTIENMQGAEYIVASGSLPAGVPADIYARIAFIARKKNARLIVDTSGEALKQAVHEGVYLIKPSLKELGSLVGKEELNMELVDDVARIIIEKGNCEVVVVSMGPAGAMLVTGDMELQIVPPVVKRKSTVGAGDSMVAGMVLSLFRGKNLIETVQYGVACGTASTMNPGTELCRREDADQLYQLIAKESKKKSG